MLGVSESEAWKAPLVLWIQVSASPLCRLTIPIPFNGAVMQSRLYQQCPPDLAIIVIDFKFWPAYISRSRGQRGRFCCTYCQPPTACPSTVAHNKLTLSVLALQCLCAHQFGGEHTSGASVKQMPQNHRCSHHPSLRLL